jgi:hypothetical protein
MDKKKLEIIITGVLMIVMVAAWYNSFKILKQRSARPVAPPQTALATFAVDLEGEVGKGISLSQKRDKFDLPWGRCPFSGKVYSGREDAVELRLTGILWDDVKPQAIINGDVVQEGNFIGHFKIIKIHKDWVQVGSGSSFLELKMEK